MLNLQKVDQKLVQLLKKLGVRDIAALREETPSHDEGDAAETSSRKETAALSSSHESLRITQIKVARARIADGTYGRCLACDHDIPEKRLKAVPETPFCIDCQDKLERDELPGFEQFAERRADPFRLSAFQ